MENEEDVLFSSMIWPGIGKAILARQCTLQDQCKSDDNGDEFDKALCVDRGRLFHRCCLPDDCDKSLYRQIAELPSYIRVFGFYSVLASYVLAALVHCGFLIIERVWQPAPLPSDSKEMLVWWLSCVSSGVTCFGGVILMLVFRTVVDLDHGCYHILKADAPRSHLEKNDLELSSASPHDSICIGSDRKSYGSAWWLKLKEGNSFQIESADGCFLGVPRQGQGDQKKAFAFRDDAENLAHLQWSIQPVKRHVYRIQNPHTRMFLQADGNQVVLTPLQRVAHHWKFATACPSDDKDKKKQPTNQPKPVVPRSSDTERPSSRFPWPARSSRSSWASWSRTSLSTATTRSTIKSVNLRKRISNFVERWKPRKFSVRMTQSEKRRHIIALRASGLGSQDIHEAIEAIDKETRHVRHICPAPTLLGAPAAQPGRNLPELPAYKQRLDAVEPPLSRGEWKDLDIQSYDDISDKLRKVPEDTLQKLCTGIKSGRVLTDHEQNVIDIARHGNRCKRLSKRSCKLDNFDWFSAILSWEEWIRLGIQQDSNISSMLIQLDENMMVRLCVGIDGSSGVPHPTHVIAMARYGEMCRGVEPFWQHHHGYSKQLGDNAAQICSWGEDKRKVRRKDRKDANEKRDRKNAKEKKHKRHGKHRTAREGSIRFEAAGSLGSEASWRGASNSSRFSRSQSIPFQD